MVLRQLVYFTVKNVVFNDDTQFTYEAFGSGSYDNAPEYSTEINNVFLPINEAISRLSDLEKIPYKVVEVNKASIDSNNVLSLSNTGVKEVISLAQVYAGGYKALKFKPLSYVGIQKILILDDVDQSMPLYLEYKEDIPFFTSAHMSVELAGFGITSSMCNYIIEYASAKLSEDRSADLSNMHVTRAEQYFANINQVKSAFPQKQIEVKYGI